MIINNGPIGGKVELEENIEYSYDGETWKNFLIYGNRGLDEHGCAEIDYNTGILSIYASGYYEVTTENKTSYPKDEYGRYFIFYGNETDETSGQQRYEQYATDARMQSRSFNCNTFFYIKFLKQNKIKYCLVGGGGGSSGGGNSIGGGGGAGGEVSYNNDFLSIPKNSILKFQIGAGGTGGGGNACFEWANSAYHDPYNGTKTIFYLNNELIGTAIGGEAASRTGAISQNNQTGVISYAAGRGEGGKGLLNNILDENNPGSGGHGYSSTTAVTAGKDGTLWPINNTYYGGGGGGAGKSDNGATFGGLGGKGGGGAGSYRNDLNGKSGNGENGLKGTGGGAGGTVSGNDPGVTGGSGIALINCKNFKKNNNIPQEFNIITNNKFNISAIGQPQKIKVHSYSGKWAEDTTISTCSLLPFNTNDNYLEIRLKGGQHDYGGGWYEDRFPYLTLGFPHPINCALYNKIKITFTSPIDTSKTSFLENSESKIYYFLSLQDQQCQYYNLSWSVDNNTLPDALTNIVKKGTLNVNNTEQIIDISDVNQTIYLYFMFLQANTRDNYLDIGELKFYND